MKGQSAIEYLTTYMWAILIISIVLSALYYLGVFNPANFVPTFCLAQGGFNCQNPVLATNGNLTFSITQVTNPVISNTIFYIAPQNTGFNANGFPNITYQCYPSNIDFNYGQTIDLVCTIPYLNGMPIGTLFEGDIWMNFSQSSSGPATLTEEIGRLAVKTSAVVSSLTTSLTTSTTSTSTSSTSTTLTSTSTTTTTFTTTSSTTTTVSSCFVGSTEVLLANGTWMPIENIKAGDIVFSYNTMTKQLYSDVVLERPVYLVNQTYTINNNTITDKYEYFYTKLSNGTMKWISAPNLTIGDEIFNPLTNNFILVNSITITNNTSVLVYDLILKNGNNYIVNRGYLADKIA